MPESNYPFFKKLMEELGFMATKNTGGELVYSSVTKGLKEVNRIRSGKLAKKPIQKLLREV